MSPPFMDKCSSIGPSEYTGKNVKAPTITTTATSMMTKSTLVLGKEAELTGTFPFFANDPAIARAGIITTNLPINMPKPNVRLQNTVLALKPANAEPLFASADE